MWNSMVINVFGGVEKVLAYPPPPLEADKGVRGFLDPTRREGSADLPKTYKNLYRSYKLPAHVLADFLPDFVLHIQLLPAFQQGKARQIIIQFQQFAEFIEDKGVRQEV